MPCNGFGSYGLVNNNFFTSPNYYAGQGQNLLILAYLAWNEKMSSLFVPSLFKNISLVVRI